ncbi:hypothetical protein [Parasphingopyxis lamellibrachiae]|uniref:hypothetical protein n=1 Tax=Parasphingopyxis lamellibrachiae TaxID=680125 RepID=UPI0011C03E83|nr:hypothetical protein [Parasphingopyxis lamellibrachiae]
MRKIGSAGMLCAALAVSGCVTTLAENHCERAGLADGMKGYQPCVEQYIAADQARQHQANQDALTLMLLGVAASGAAQPNAQATPIQPLPPASTHPLPPAYRPQPSTIMCPDGTFVYGVRCRMAPDGSFVGVIE